MKMLVAELPPQRPTSSQTARGSHRRDPKSGAKAQRSSFRRGRPALGVGQTLVPSAPTFAEGAGVECPEAVDGTGPKP